MTNAIKEIKEKPSLVLSTEINDIILTQHFNLPPNKRSFRDPGGFGRGLDLRCQVKICAREPASVVSRCLKGASRGLPLTAGRTIDIDAKFPISHWDQNSNVKAFWPYNNLSGHAQTFPPGYRNFQECSHRLQGV